MRSRFAFLEKNLLLCHTSAHTAWGPKLFGISGEANQGLAGQTIHPRSTFPFNMKREDMFPTFHTLVLRVVQRDCSY